MAKRFARDGYDVGLIGMDADVLRTLESELRERGVQVAWKVADLTDVAAHAAAVTALGEELGGIDVLHFNPSAFRAKNPMELTVGELLEDVALGVGGLLTAVQAARPFMKAGGRVTATGSMAADRPSASAASLGRAEGRPAEPCAHPRHDPEARRHPCRVADGPRHAGQGGAVHA